MQIPSLTPKATDPGLHTSNPSLDALQLQTTQPKQGFFQRAWQKVTSLWRSKDQVADQTQKAADAITQHAIKEADTPLAPATENISSSDIPISQLQSCDVLERLDACLEELEAINKTLAGKITALDADTYQSEIIDGADSKETVLRLHQSLCQSTEAFAAQQRAWMEGTNSRINDDILLLNDCDYDNTDEEEAIAAKIQEIKTAQSKNHAALQLLTNRSSELLQVATGRQDSIDNITSGKVLLHLRSVMEKITLTLDEYCQAYNKITTEIGHYRLNPEPETTTPTAQAHEFLNNLYLKKTELYEKLQDYTKKSEHCIIRLQGEADEEAEYIRLRGELDNPNALQAFQETYERTSTHLERVNGYIRDHALAEEAHRQYLMEQLAEKTEKQLAPLVKTSDLFHDKNPDNPGGLSYKQNEECITELKILQSNLVAQAAILRSNPPVTEVEEEIERIFGDLFAQIQTCIQGLTTAQQTRQNVFSRLFGQHHQETGRIIKALDERLYTLRKKIASIESDLASDDPKVLLNSKGISEFQALQDESIQLDIELGRLHQKSNKGPSINTRIGRLLVPNATVVRDLFWQRLMIRGTLDHQLHELTTQLQEFAEAQVDARIQTFDRIKERTNALLTNLNEDLAAYSDRDRVPLTERNNIARQLDYAFEELKREQDNLKEELGYYTTLNLPNYIKQCTNLEATVKQQIEQVIALQDELKIQQEALEIFEFEKVLSNNQKDSLQKAEACNKATKAVYKDVKQQLIQLQTMSSAKSEKYHNLCSMKAAIDPLVDSLTVNLEKLDQQKDKPHQSQWLKEQVTKHTEETTELITSLKTLKQEADELLLHSSAQQIQATREELAAITVRWDEKIETIEDADKVHGEIPADDVIKAMEDAVRNIQPTKNAHKNTQTQLLSRDFPEIKGLIQTQKANITRIKNTMQKQAASQIPDMPDTPVQPARVSGSSSGNAVAGSQTITPQDTTTPSATPQTVIKKPGESEKIPEQKAVPEQIPVPKQDITPSQQSGQDTTPLQQSGEITPAVADTPQAPIPQLDLKVQEDRNALATISENDKAAKKTVIQIARKAHGDANQVAETRALLAADPVAVKYLAREIVRTPGVTGLISYAFRSIVAKIAGTYLGTTALTELHDLYAADKQKKDTPEEKVLTEEARLKVLANLLENEAIPESFKKKIIYGNHGTTAWEYLAHIESYANVPDYLNDATLEIKTDDNDKTINLIGKLISNMETIRGKSKEAEAQAMDLDALLSRSITEAKEAKGNNSESSFSKKLSEFEDQLEKQRKLPDQP